MPRFTNYLLPLLLAARIASSASLAAADSSTDDPVIAKMRQAAPEFIRDLPNFVCREIVSRFYGTPSAGWRPLDTLSAELVFAAGKEDYGSLAVNGKPVHSRMDQVRGAWSKGEFGSILDELLSPETAAVFRRVPGPLAEYEFVVPPDRSQWRIYARDRGVIAGYKGVLIIEPDTGRILHIEMETFALPARFPAQRVTTSIDYQEIQLGARQFLLPVHSEMLMCFSGQGNCVRNEISFADYRKFASESSVLFASAATADRP